MSGAEEAARAIGRQCLAGRMRRLTRIVTRTYDEALRPLGLSVGQLSVLVAISNGGRTSTRLCRNLGLEQSSLSRNLALMKRRGWVQAERGRDARSLELRLTKKGDALISRALPHWRRAQRATSRLLGTEGSALLSKLVDERLAAGTENPA